MLQLGNNMVLFACGIVGIISGLSDNVHFSINWAGPLSPETLSEQNKPNIESEMMIITNKEEKYHCFLPKVADPATKAENGLSPKQVELELLKPLFDQTTCTFRLEAYWTYELCHGRHLRQFHQEMEPPKLQEYYLGTYSMEAYSRDLQKAKEHLEESDQPKQTKMRVVRGKQVAYYEVLYTDGTLCDLTGQPRRVSVQYVCEPEGRGEMDELKETSSCEYEVVIRTSLLCAHPAYGPKKQQVNAIQCHSKDNAPLKPAGLHLFESSSTAGRYNSQQERLMSNIWNTLNDMIKQASKEKAEESREPAAEEFTYPQPLGRARADQSGHFIFRTEELKQATEDLVVKDFLAGTYCVQGGTGWWKHEFCYGKKVSQFHEDRSGRVDIVLGVWDTAKHLEWLANNPRKQPKPLEERTTITQFYSNGEVCDITGKQRSVEVRLKCSQSASHPNSIALYMVEPKPCEYKLVVESQILCPLIKKANIFGIIPDEPQS